MKAPAEAHALLDRMWTWHGTTGITIRHSEGPGRSIIASGGQTTLVQICESRSEPGELLAYTRPPWEKLDEVPDQYAEIA